MVRSLLKAFGTFDAAGTRSTKHIIDSPSLFQLYHPDINTYLLLTHSNLLNLSDLTFNCKALSEKVIASLESSLFTEVLNTLALLVWRESAANRLTRGLTTP